MADLAAFKKRADDADKLIGELTKKYDQLHAKVQGLSSSGSTDEVAAFQAQCLEKLRKVRELITKETEESAKIKAQNEQLKVQRDSLKAQQGQKSDKPAAKSETKGEAKPTAAGEKPLFTINGFYMAMRDKYTKPGASIHFFVAEWESSKLAWKDFRGTVLGATDPVTAAAGSLREEIYRRWQDFGLQKQPDVGDNSVHASASPFEGLVERLNWVGATLEKDAFGAALLANGISKEAILQWSRDPQVDIDGSKASLFDSFEDLNAEDVLAKAQSIAGVKKVSKKKGAAKAPKNQAFVFVKPHAVTDSVVAFVKSGLEKAGITILQEGRIPGDVIEKQQLIDNHYYAIANKASLTKPKDLNPPEKARAAFQQKWGLSWEAALAEDLVLNALDVCQKLNIDGAALDSLWAQSKKADELVKFGGGFYCGRLALPAAEKKDKKASAKGSEKGKKKGADPAPADAPAEAKGKAKKGKQEDKPAEPTPASDAAPAVEKESTPGKQKAPKKESKPDQAPADTDATPKKGKKKEEAKAAEPAPEGKAEPAADTTPAKPAPVADGTPAKSGEAPASEKKDKKKKK